MDGDVIDAGAGRAVVVMEQVGGGGHAARDFSDQAAFAAPVAPHRAAITVVPFRPLRGKRADLIAAHAEIPWLGDELDGRQHRVLPHRGQKRGIAVVSVRPARQRGGEVEAEAVDVTDLDPVAQRIHRHLQHARMGQVDRAAAAGEVVVVARIFLVEPVIGRVVDAAERQRRAEMIALGGVVIDHVEHHLDAGVVQPRHRGAERVERVVLRIARLRREERQRVVAPVVGKLPLHQHPVVDQPVDRQQFDGGDAEFLEMVDHRRRAQPAIGAAPARRDVVALLRQALDVGLVDDGVFPGDVRPYLAAAPVEALVDHDRLRHAARIVAAVKGKILARAPRSIAEMRVAPHQAAGEPLGIGIEQQLVGVEAVPAFGRIGAVDAIAIELPGRDVVEIAVPDVLVALGQFDPLEFAAALAVEQAKLDLFRIGREQRKVGAPSVPACT